MFLGNIPTGRTGVDCEELSAFLEDKNMGVSEMSVWVGQCDVNEVRPERGARVGMGRTQPLLASVSKGREEPPEKLVVGGTILLYPAVSSGGPKNHVDMRQINSNKSI